MKLTPYKPENLTPNFQNFILTPNPGFFLSEKHAEQNPIAQSVSCAATPWSFELTANAIAVGAGIAGKTRRPPPKQLNMNVLQKSSPPPHCYLSVAYPRVFQIFKIFKICVRVQILRFPRIRCSDFWVP